MLLLIKTKIDGKGGITITLSKNYAYIYDTVFFLIIYFNRGNFDDFFEPYCSKDCDPFENFEYIKKQLPELPKILFPIFKASDKTSVFSRFFEKTGQLSKTDIEDLISSVADGKDIIYNEIISDISEKVAPSEKPPKNNAELIEAAEISDTDKYQFALLLGNFDYAITELCEALRIVCLEIERLHKSKSSEIEKLFVKLTLPSNIKLIQEEHKLDITKINNPIIFVSLINPYVIGTTIDTVADITYITVGINFYTYIINIDNMHSAKRFVSACGSELRIEMLTGLSKKGEMTLTDFSHYLKLPTTTVIHNLRILLNAGIIEVSRKEPKYIYYRANQTYLSQVKKGINKLLDTLIN